MTSAFLQTRTARAVVSVFAFASLALPALSASAAGPQADLAVTIAGPTSVESTTKTVTYNLTVNNLGSARANQVTFKVATPGALKKMTPASSNIRVTCQQISPLLFTCQFINPLLVNKVQKFSVEVDVVSAIKSACSKNPVPSLVATATVTSSTTTVDPNPWNNTSKTSSTVNCPQKSADLSLSVPTVTPSIPVVGSYISFNQIVANAGPDTPTNVTLTVTAPTGFIFNPSKSLAGCITQGSSIICKNFLPMGFFDITFDVPKTVACGSIVNYTATVTATEKDPILANNSRSVQMTVACPADLVLKNVEVVGRAASSMKPGKDGLQIKTEVFNAGFVSTNYSILVTAPKSTKYPDGFSDTIAVNNPLDPSASHFSSLFWDRYDLGSTENLDEYFTFTVVLKNLTDIAPADNIKTVHAVIPAPPSRKLGDVNNDGKIASADTILMRRHYDKVITLTGDDFIAGDVDLDGFVNYPDFYLERGFIGQQVDAFPALYGDMNGDGKLTADDTALLADFVSGVKTPTTRQKFLGDVNADGYGTVGGPILDQKDVEWLTKAIPKLVLLPVLCGNTLLNTDVHEQCDDGNQTNGDGCSNMCMIETVVQNELTIVQKAMTSTDTAVRNQKDLPLLRFEAKADNEGILLTELKFDLAQGSFLNATNYTLKVDTNADGVVDTTLQAGVSPLNGVLAFDTLVGAGFALPSTQAVIVEVRADIASSTVSNLLQLKFATTVPSYISAERSTNADTLDGIKTDGTCAVTCEITVVTNISTLWNISSQGNLFITNSLTPVRSRQLLGGALSDDILRLSLRADSEDIDVTNLVFTVVGSDASTFSQNVSRFELYQVGAVTPFAVASIAGCGADLVPAYSVCAVMNSAELIVPKGSNSELLVRARMKSDLDGAVSGKKLTVSIDAVQGAKARGLASGNFLSPNNGDTLATGETFIGVSSAGPSQTIVGKDHVSVMSKVVTITNADPNTNGTGIPSGSNRAISQLKFTAASHANVSSGMNKVVIDTVIYTVNTTNVALDPSAFKIYNKADPTVKATCSLDPASSATVQYVVCPNLSTSAIYSVVEAGSDATLVLEANVLNTQVNPSLSSLLQVSLQNFSNSTLASLSVAGSHIRWFDQDNSTSTTFLWMESPETVINGTSYQS